MHSVKKELIETVRRLVAANPGQCSEKEYLSILDTLIRKAPCNFLVFGVGRDTGLWAEANHNGDTMFVEPHPHWIETVSVNSAATARLINIALVFARALQW
jgi:hypothetical protein